jgi:hypothetical protein
MPPQIGAGACMSRNSATCVQYEPIFNQRYEGVKLRFRMFDEFYNTTIQHVMSSIQIASIAKDISYDAIMRFAPIQIDVNFLNFIADKVVPKDGNVETKLEEVKNMYAVANSKLDQIISECSVKELQLSLPNVPSRGGKKSSKPKKLKSSTLKK